MGKASDLTGSEMIFELASAAREWLSVYQKSQESSGGLTKQEGARQVSDAVLVAVPEIEISDVAHMQDLDEKIRTEIAKKKLAVREFKERQLSLEQLQLDETSPRSSSADKGMLLRTSRSLWSLASFICT